MPHWASPAPVCSFAYHAIKTTDEPPMAGLHQSWPSAVNCGQNGKNAGCPAGRVEPWIAHASRLWWVAPSVLYASLPVQPFHGNAASYQLYTASSVQVRHTSTGQLEQFRTLNLVRHDCSRRRYPISGATRCGWYPSASLMTRSTCRQLPVTTTAAHVSAEAHTAPCCWQAGHRQCLV
jgi:hypothetical protein